MSRDLNLKKSWHPGLLKNQEVVWKREKEALEERKKILERQKEIQQEREKDELLSLQDAATGKKRVKRLEWMYSEANGGSMGALGDDKEAYLLGKKRIDDSVILGGTSNQEVDKLRKDGDSDRFGQSEVQGFTSGRDLASKVKGDPMLQIKKIQMEKAIAKAQEEAARREKRSKHSRDDDRDRSRRSHHRDSYEEDKRRRRSRDRYRNSKDPESDGHNRSSRDGHRSSRDYRDSDRDRDNRDRSSRDYREFDRYRDNRHRSSRDRSPTDSEDVSRERGSSSRHGSRSRSDRGSDLSRLPRGYQERQVSIESAPSRNEEERQKRLAAMMEDAQKLESSRGERLEASQMEDEREKAEEEERKKKAGVYGGQGTFIRTATKNLIEGSTEALRRGRIAG